MQFNTKIRYGVRTMIQITLDSETGIYQKDIAEKQELPIKYLDHIIAALKAEKLIRKSSGKKSGYVLARPAKNISVYDVYLAFEPELAIAPCHEADDPCERVNLCATALFWGGLNDTIKDYLKNTSLHELALSQKEIEEKSNHLTSQ